MICKQSKYKEDAASKPLRHRTDGALRLPEVHLRASSDRICSECICIKRKESLCGTVELLVLMGSAV